MMIRVIFVTSHKAPLVKNASPGTFEMGRHSSVFHVFAVAARAPAPRPASTTSALPPVMIASTSFAGRRRPHKGEVDGNLLLEELFVVCALDCSLGFVEGGVLDEDVSLLDSQLMPSSTFLFPRRSQAPAAVPARPPRTFT